jgi:Ca2+-binding RTX toxin-like protein
MILTFFVQGRLFPDQVGDSIGLLTEAQMYTALQTFFGAPQTTTNTITWSASHSWSITNQTHGPDPSYIIVNSFSDIVQGFTVASATNVAFDTTAFGQSTNTTLIERLFAGNDTINMSSDGGYAFAFAGNDTLNGGSGSDNLGGMSGDDIINGGGGEDTADYRYATGGVTVSLLIAGPQAVGGGEGTDTLTSIEDIYASAFGDTLTGNAGTNWLFGNGGDDILSGMGSLDWLSGGDGNDTLIGGDGNDNMFGDNGSDTLTGGAGADLTTGDAGDDTFIVAAGDYVSGESISGGTGTDTLRTMGASIDYRVGSVSSLERIQFAQGAGETTLNAMFNASQIGAGLSSTLVLTGSAAQDSIQIFTTAGQSVNTSGWTFEFPGWEFQDYIVYVGESGNETFVGWGGLDIYFGSPGNDSYDGRGAFDFAAYLFSPNAVTADLAIAGAQAIGGNQGSDTFINLEGLAGSQFADQLFGNSGDNIILGLFGDDIIVGRDGNDDLRGAEGSDRLEGGAGADVLWGASDLPPGSPDVADTFVYRIAAHGGDTIRDFQASVDRIEVSASGFGGGLVAGGAVTLISSANPVATGASGVFLYNTTTGQISWDADGAGAGAAVVLATLQGAPAITAANITVTSIAAASFDGGNPVEEAMGGTSAEVCGVFDDGFADSEQASETAFSDAGVDFDPGVTDQVDFRYHLMLGALGTDAFAFN